MSPSPAAGDSSLPARCIMHKFLLFPAALSIAGDTTAQDAKDYAGNPVVPGWHADPEAIILGDAY